MRTEANAESPQDKHHPSNLRGAGMAERAIWRLVRDPGYAMPMLDMLRKDGIDLHSKTKNKQF
ncbi:MAG: hypothetical protein M1504_01240 [Candidatus Marsarchaeota archaeon]|nr:hypothetical protein [Candidatus Marsarchaeota archaeon]